MKDIILEIKEVSKNFGGIKALDKASLDIEKGKINAVIGPNGSGKSTLFNVISGLYKIENGEIKFEGKDIYGLEDYNIAKLGISRTFQEVRLFKNLNIREHLEIALSEEDEKMIKSAFIGEQRTEKKIREILDLVGLDKPLKTKAINLSYGQRKLLDIGVAFAKKHKLLMLDEPVAGINPELRNKIKKILKKLKKEGETILLIEHDMNFVMEIADYVYVLDNGLVIAKGKPKQIQKNKKVLDAYLGGSI
jgi:branched-chain amino acid transport system ATP-binding protein